MEKGTTLQRLVRCDEAFGSLGFGSLGKAFDINPLYAAAWESKGNIFYQVASTKKPSTALAGLGRLSSSIIPSGARKSSPLKP